MKIVISPAKSLDLETALPTSNHTQPEFQAEAQRLNKLLKKKSARSLSKLMHISDALATLNYERNQAWSLPFDDANSRPAMFTFAGDVYRGLDAFTMDEEAIDFAQGHLLILSGLYGLLKPLDLMQAYRLEMGTKMPVGVKKNLYEFWKQKITKQLNEEMDADDILINLASNEYFKAIDTKALKATVVTPVFKEFKNGQYKTIGTFAKPARGMMSRHLIDTKGTTVDDIKAFNKEGYGFSEELSSETELVFTR
ncbi:peroxide stress protein YaaA [Gilvibacter sediminis]|uniref:peroxide stress protein YaaA n=1 Tax=Gilvibacter sediminis TaxID=379071 RepID=UPI002350B505|nr:peroxide stress protein YaaA [Gilvibacter sediminis]MDC7998517.1 peroxide stress protein YaaA [Gilvibacter sediminis]